MIRKEKKKEVTIRKQMLVKMWASKRNKQKPNARSGLIHVKGIDAAGPKLSTCGRSVSERRCLSCQKQGEQLQPTLTTFITQHLPTPLPDPLPPGISSAGPAQSPLSQCPIVRQSQVKVPSPKSADKNPASCIQN